MVVQGLLLQRPWHAIAVIILWSLPLFDPITTSSGLLLCSSLGLGGLLLVAVDHHNAYEGAHHGRAQESQDNGDANGPDTGREEVVERMAGVDEGLNKGHVLEREPLQSHRRCKQHTINNVHAV